MFDDLMAFENSLPDPEYPFYVREQSAWVAKHFPKMAFLNKEKLIMELKEKAIDVVAEENFSSNVYIKHGREVII